MSQNDDNTFIKDPEAVLDYSWYWADWLDGDMISDYTVEVDQGDIIKDDDENTSTTVTAWFSGGTKFSSAICQITTSDGRVDERTIYFDIEDR